MSPHGTITWNGMTLPGLEGSTAVVTGANSGTGKAAAEALAATGARVIMAVRTPTKGDAARTEILSKHPGADVEVRRLDLADLASVRAFADAFLQEDRPVDILINNAGLLGPSERRETADGFELMFGTNVLGPFALTMRLLPALRRSTAARVVGMTSGMAATARLNFEDLQSTRSFQTNAVYGRSKLADLMLTLELDRVSHSRGWRLVSTAAHPGAARTGFATAGPALVGKQPPFYYRIIAALVPSQSSENGARPLVHAATTPEVRGGELFGPRWGMVGGPVRARIYRSARDQGQWARLWREAERLTGTGLATAS